MREHYGLPQFKDATNLGLFVLVTGPLIVCHVLLNYRGLVRAHGWKVVILH